MDAPCAEGIGEPPDTEDPLEVRRRAVELGATELRALLDDKHKAGAGGMVWGWCKLSSF